MSQPEPQAMPGPLASAPPLLVVITVPGSAVVGQTTQRHQFRWLLLAFLLGIFLAGLALRDTPYPSRGTGPESGGPTDD